MYSSPITTIDTEEMTPEADWQLDNEGSLCLWDSSPKKCSDFQMSLPDDVTFDATV